jgi:hypothetical protein
MRPLMTAAPQQVPIVPANLAKGDLRAGHGCPGRFVPSARSREGPSDRALPLARNMKANIALAAA